MERSTETLHLRSARICVTISRPSSKLRAFKQISFPFSEIQIDFLVCVIVCSYFLSEVMNKIFETLRQFMEKDQSNAETRKKLLSEDASEQNEGLISLYIEAQANEDSNSENGIEIDRDIIKKLIQIADSVKIKDINMAFTILANAAMTESQIPIMLAENVLNPMVKFLSTIDPKEAPKKPVQLSEADANHHKNALLACLDAVSRLLEDAPAVVTFGNLGGVKPLYRMLYYRGQCIERQLAVDILDKVAENALIRDIVIPQFKEELPGKFLEIRDKIFLSPYSKIEADSFREMSRHLDLLTDLYKPGLAFYELDDFPWTKMLEENFETIKQEFLTLQQRNLVAWPEKYLCKKGWDVLGLYAFSNKFEENCNLCPKTTEIIEKIPGLTTALFSCLQPRTHIKPHIGYYSYSEKILRCHLGILVPQGCALKVNGEIQQWQVGKCMVFDDTFRHEAWNKSDEMRVVLMLDFAYTGDQSKRNQEFLKTAKLMEMMNKNNPEEDEDALISGDLVKALKMYGASENVKQQDMK